MSSPQANVLAADARFAIPTLKVILNGSIVLPAYSASWNNVGHFSSDNYTVNCTMSDMPTGYDEIYWGNTSGNQIEIQVGYAGQTPVSFITGNVDKIDWDVCKQTLTLTGRDLSALGIDTKIVSISMNQTSSQIAAQLAAGHGMQTNIAATTTSVGTYFQQDNVSTENGQFTHLSRDQSEWDLLIYLAQQEGFDLWVSGNTLNFQPSLDLTKVPPYTFQYEKNPGGVPTGNFVGLKLNRSETLAGDIIVNVQSWNVNHQSKFQVSYRRTNAGKSQRAGGKSQVYSFIRPNLTQDQAKAFALQMLEDISRQERIMDVEMDGELTIGIRTPLQLIGTGTAYDQKYYPDSVQRSLSFTSFDQTIRAKNHSIDSTVEIL